MASRPIRTLQATKDGEGKQKNGKVARNSRVLKDIGNLDIDRPVTRNFHKQLVGKAEAGAGDKFCVKKPTARVVNGGLRAKAVAPAKRAIPNAESGEQKLIVVEEKFKNLCIKRGAKGKNLKNPDAKLVDGDSQAKEVKNEEKLEEQKPLVLVEKTTSTSTGTTSSSPVRSSTKTLTSILSARSNAYLGIFDFNPQVSCESEKNWHLKDNHILNIDALDVNNELAVVEYVEDIYQFYKQAEEEEGTIQDYMDSQPQINSKMRAILIDWLIDVHRKYELMPETLYLTINIIDRYLAIKAVAKKHLQLVGISSMLIASKYEEYWGPKVSELISISDNSYRREEILLMEKKVLAALKWHLTVPTPYVFLVRYIKASFPMNQEMENMAFFLTELGLMHYPIVTSNCPSKLAAAAVYAARCTLNKVPVWTNVLKHHTGYSLIQISDCAKLLGKLHSNAATSELNAVYRKYKSSKKGSVACLAPAASLMN